MSELGPLPGGIVLCIHCGTRLSKPGSLPPGASPVCADCAQERASTRRLQAVKALEWVSIDESPRPELHAAVPGRRMAFPIAAAGLVALLALGGMLLRGGRSHAHGPRAKETAAAPEQALEPAEDPAVRKAVQAKKEAEEARVRRQTELREELAALDQETSALEAKEEFSRVLEILSRAQDRHEEALWVEGVGERDGAVRAKIEAQFAAIRDVASETADPGEKARLRDRVVRWGLRAPLEDLEKLWAVVPPPAPPVRRSKEAAHYEEEWEQALAPAAGRNYDRALSALRQAAKGLQEEVVRRGAAADLDDLEKVKLLYGELLGLLPAWPRGR
ncbi:MAG TPA: hypothetical protein VEN81_04450, partial [Planctomycetota bacterium]|nr:hypothetical protein [Planctomycetota bacterium]